MATVDELNIRLKADTTDLKRGLSEAQNSVRTLADEVKGYFAAFIGIESLKKVVELTSEAEKSQTRLAAVVRATGEAAGVSAEDFGKFAEKLETMTLFDGEKIRDAGAILLTFKSIQGDVFESATRSALDMAATFNTDLSSAAVMLGKALEDPIAGLTALRRVGVSFTQSQREMITSLVEGGHQFEAQRKILDILEGQVGGVAEAMGQGLAGELHRTRIAFEDLAKELGNTLQQFNFISDGALQVSDSINMLTKFVIEMGEYFNYAGLGMLKFANVLGIVNDELMDSAVEEAMERKNKLLEENTKRLEEFEKKTSRVGKADLETTAGNYTPEPFVDEEKLKKSKREVESLRKELEKTNLELKAKVDTFYDTPEQQKLAEFRAKLEANREAFEKMGEAGQELKMEIEGNIIALENMEHSSSDVFKQMQKYARDTADTMARDFARAIVSTNGSFSSMRSFAMNILNDIAAKLLEITVTRPLMDAAVGGLGSLFGSFGGGGSSAATAASGDIVFGSAATAPISGFAEGGQPPVGVPSIVGERGMELFVPNSAGTIIPNDKLGGNSSINVTQIFNMSPGLAETVGAAIRDAAPVIQRNAQQGVFDAIERGGVAARSVGRRI